MKVPVLYGPDSSKDYSEELRFVGSRLGKELGEVWDGCTDQDFPETPEKLRNTLLSFLDEKDVSFVTSERISHSLGKSSPEILLAKHGAIPGIVDAVVYPSLENAGSVLAGLKEREFSAVIYGGGTSVSGSLLMTGKSPVVSIDTSRLKGMAMGEWFAVFGSGMTGQEAEREANRHGYTLGNFPESFRHSTLGGWVATKEVGQESNQYGGIERMLMGVRMVTSSGEMEDRLVPRESAGLAAKDIALGSDGRYGLITEVTLRVFRIPRHRYYSSRIYQSFKEGIDALSRTNRFPSVARLSDEVETEFALKTAGDSGMVKLYRKYVSMRGYSRGSLLIVVNNEVDIQPVKAISMSAGSAPARSWMKNRFERPGVANALWKYGLVPDTLETSATWDRLYVLYEAVRKKFNMLKEELGFSGEIMAHISHLYREGACIYFTYIIESGNEISDLERIRKGLVDTFLAIGGAITHHHGYGKYFSEYVEPEIARLQSKLEDPLFKRGE